MEGIPRAVFMLMGGAITDRLSARLIMFMADVIRLILTATMTVVVLMGIVQTWMLYVFSLGFGLLMSAFSGGNMAGYPLAGALPSPSGIAIWYPFPRRFPVRSANGPESPIRLRWRVGIAGNALGCIAAGAASVQR